MNDLSSFKCQEFYSARELAEIAKKRGITNFPHTIRGVLDYAERSSWHVMGERFCRKRAGRGGGLEYHFTLLPDFIIATIEGYAMKEAVKAAQEAGQVTGRSKMDALKAALLGSRARAVMEARAEVLQSIDGYAISQGQKRSWGITQFLKAQEAYETRQDIELRRDAGQILTVDEAASLAKPLLLTADHGFCLDPARITLANDRKTATSVKRRAIYDWFKTRDEAGATALAPTPPKAAAPIHPGFAGFLKHYAIGSKPSAPDALKRYLKEENPPKELRITLNQVKHILNNRLNNIERNVGREGLLTLRSRLAYVTRTDDDMWPTTIYSGDGKTFDAEIADPVTKRPIRPEITTIVDTVTRKIVGISLARSENQRSVAEALRNSCVNHGIPAIFYVDRGPGYKNNAMDADVSGLMGRLGITKMHAEAYGSQAKGRIEIINRNVWNPLAKDLPTYMGQDMDKEAGDKIHKLTRRELKEFGFSRSLPSWDEFVRLCEEKVEEYNAKPHLSLPKFEDPETGRLRHMSPNDCWEAHAQKGFEPVPVDADEADDLFRPYVIRVVRRAQVDWGTNTYFDMELERYHTQKVMVGYDYHQADKVWVREFDVSTGQPGRLICVAGFMANAERYVPLSYEEKALETRANARKKRLEDKIEGVEAERNAPYLVDQSESLEASFLDVTPEPIEAVDLSPIQLAVDNTSVAPRRRTFGSDEELAAWALENPEELTRGQIEVLRECMDSATARELFRLSGIDTEALRNLLRVVA
ncbi:Mu transposase C-terminal domain-containing protein [uncultured Celeribacter sp.]|uniref:Mu transposase C-terminal domain-containing protein n=1 Tax=uncultured Celeribacter sp. TaxID=1303376 RepID=UPI002AA6A7B4|nr:Mu transposase C-terminal domain-containing protein [uncultured Celeribacter sp.]